MSQTFTPAELFSGDLEESLLGQPSAEVLGEEIRVRSHVPFVGTNPGIRSGVWEASPGLSRWEFVERGEAIYVIEGRMVVTEDNKDSVTLESGSVAIFPIGWKGTWEIQERIRKFFVVFAP